jgi:single-stranded DNA-binding protein
VTANNVQFLGGRADGDGGGQQFVPAGASQPASADFPASAADDDIPF